MEIRLKSREALYCNLKLFLLFLVVTGHLLEPVIREHDMAYEIYRMIYCVHMPLFVFLSGLFVKSGKSALLQARKSFWWYLFWQGLYVVVMFLFGKRECFTKPYWHLWYLLSLTWWCLAAWGYYRLEKKVRVMGEPIGKLWILLLAVMVACLAGEASWIGRKFSLSRTLVFAPYFFAGMFCRSDTEWRKYRLFGFIFLVLGLFLYDWKKESLSVVFLYQAANYGSLDFETGVFRRLLCYGIGIGLGFVFLTWMPDRRFPWTKAGADTMMMYVLHGPVVKCLWEFSEHAWYPAAVPAMAVWILYTLFKIFQWHRPLFRIKGGKVPDYGGI